MTFNFLNRRVSSLQGYAMRAFKDLSRRQPDPSLRPRRRFRLGRAAGIPGGAR